MRYLSVYFLHIVQYPLPLSHILFVVTHIHRPILKFEFPFSIFLPILKRTLKNSISVFQHPLTMKFLAFIESTRVLTNQLIFFSFVPFQLPLSLFSVHKIALKSVLPTNLHLSLPIKHVAIEFSFINEVILHNFSFSLCDVFLKETFKIGSITKDIRSLSFSFSIFKMS